MSPELQGGLRIGKVAVTCAVLDYLRLFDWEGLLAMTPGGAQGGRAPGWAEGGGGCCHLCDAGLSEGLSLEGRADNDFRVVPGGGGWCHLCSAGSSDGLPLGGLADDDPRVGRRQGRVRVG